MDVKELLTKNPVEEIIGRYLTLKPNGIHLKGKCPFHDDKHASLTVTPSKQIVKCFACGWSGDGIAFVMEYTGKDFKEACHEIETNGITTLADNEKRTTIKKPKPIQTKQIMPPSAPATISHYIHGEPAHVWTYRQPIGDVIGYVCRFDTPEGKEVLPYTYRTDGKRSEWRWHGFDSPRPLYNLHLITANPTASVLIVEGEKSADAAQEQLDPARTVVTTWTGGSNAVSLTDFTPLYGRKILLFGDNDVQGLSAMLHIRHLIREHVPLTKIVPLDNTLPKGWDCADKQWQPNELRDFVISRLQDDIPANNGTMWRFKQVGADAIYDFGHDGERWTFKQDKTVTPPVAELPPPPDDLPPYEQPFIPDPPAQNYDKADYFRFLGYAKSDNAQQEFYFFVYASKQVYRFTTASMTQSNLLTLAPLVFWEDHYPPTGRSAKFDSMAAINWLVNTSNKVGTYKGRLIRGRGAWMDAGRSVVHVGNRLIVDFNIKPLEGLQTKYIYEASEELELSIREPLKSTEAVKFLDLVKRLSWERDINAYLLAGWCVVAPMCGALKWRPHIWLTGGAGTGKSWVFDKIVRRLLGNTALAVQGETSEAGIRQTLGHDALPVVFDESEGADRKANERMQSVMALMRSASAEDGGVMAKGSAGGTAKTFRIRSCFAFASIAVQLKQQSDRTRVSIIGLRTDLRPNKADIWSETIRMYSDLFTDEFVERFQSRTIKLLPTVLKNAETFAAAGAAELGTQRMGDQIGSLLAGVYSLHSDKEISYDAAVKWIKDKDWSDEKGLQGSNDEIRLVSHLVEQIVSVETDTGRHDRTVGELVNISKNEFDPIDKFVNSTDADKQLRRIGFKVDASGGEPLLIVSNNSYWIRQKLSNTAWPENHHTILARIQGSHKVESTQFAPGVRQRGVAIPLGALWP